jgi:hypothetical protein
VKCYRESPSLLPAALRGRVADSYNAVDVAHSKHGGKAVAREAVVKILRGHKSLPADLKVALTVEQWFHGIDS